MKKIIILLSLIPLAISIPCNARYFDPTIGRWLVPDPLAGKYPNISPYVYCLNNPLRNVDPDGQDITSTMTEDEEGNKHYAITYTATIVNESSQCFSSEQMGSVAQDIKKQIEDSYSGMIVTGEGKQISWETKADIVVADSPREGDNIFKIIDTDKLGKSQILGSIQQISSNLVGSNNHFQIGRTGAHEFGHGGGLPHPTDPNTGEVIKIDVGNLMQQTRYSKGTFINIDQIEKLNKLVNFWYGARKK